MLDKIPKQVLLNLKLFSYVLSMNDNISMPDILDIIIIQKVIDPNDIIDSYWKQVKEPESAQVSLALRKTLSGYSRTIQASSDAIDELSHDDILYLLESGEEIYNKNKQEARKDV